MDYESDSQWHHLRTISDLPTYSWDHSKSYWHESRVSRQHRLRQHPYHDLCGIRSLDDTTSEPRWRHILNLETLPWLQDHQVDGVIVFPGAGYIAMAIEAATQITHTRNKEGKIRKYILKNVQFETLLEIQDPNSSVELHMSFRTSSTLKSESGHGSWEEFRIASVKLDGSTTHHCSGFIGVEFHQNEEPLENLNSLASSPETQMRAEYNRLLQDEEHQPWNVEALYQGLKNCGHYWGPTFAMIRNFNIGKCAGTGTVTVPDIAECMPSQFLRPHTIHPATLDALIHSTLIIFSRQCHRSVMFPVEIGELSIRADVLRSPGENIAFSALIDPEDQLEESTMNVIAWNIKQHGGLEEAAVILKNGKLRGTENVALRQDKLSGSTGLFSRLQWRNDIYTSPPTACMESKPKRSLLGSTPAELTLALNSAALNLVKFGITQIQISGGDVAPQHVQYYDWMKSLVHTEIHDTWGQNASIKSIQRSVEEMSVEGTALDTIKSHILPILQGKTHAVSLLMENGLLDRLYSSDWSAAACLPSVISYFEHLAFKTPGLSIIEIGAGTGGATLPLLEAIFPQARNSSFKNYQFTDISSGFFPGQRNFSPDGAQS
ncbi:uncharacterized protein N7483_000825 [Penicillium malachiteum]|uniref:uncharacterized protein n=1 Tax=Penicillium malachiteum TaxID=1324776 RepID=UPI0025473AD6|nr:uncharacterized protein N7483_000825 [Penicillium malachiteum]KAJ5735700.1 hypothetical protein N7483_000825 [Penicillium malachiteum]